MTTHDALRLARRQWRIVLAGAILGPLVALALTFVVTPSYASQMQMFVSSSGGTASDRLQNLQYTNDRVASYARLVGSPFVMNAVRRSMGLPPDGPSLVDKVEATNPLETSIIDVTVHDSSPDRAQAVAWRIGQVFNSVVNEVEHGDDGADDPIRITVVAPPPAAVVRESPSHLLYIGLGLVGGLLVGMALAVARDAQVNRRNQRRSAADRSAGSRPPAGPPTNGVAQSNRPATARSDGESPVQARPATPTRPPPARPAPARPGPWSPTSSTMSLADMPTLTLAPLGRPPSPYSTAPPPMRPPSAPATAGPKPDGPGPDGPPESAEARQAAAEHAPSKPAEPTEPANEVSAATEPTVEGSTTEATVTGSTAAASAAAGSTTESTTVGSPATVSPESDDPALEEHAESPAPSADDDPDPTATRRLDERHPARFR